MRSIQNLIRKLRRLFGRPALAGAAAMLFCLPVLAANWGPGQKIPANQFVAGPTSGASAAPQVRALTTADLAAVLTWKQPAEVVAITNQSVAVAAATYDATAPLTSGTSRILLTAQTAPAENGLWIWNGAGAALTRPTDYTNGSTTMAFYGCYVAVISGSALVDTQWVITTTGTLTIGTTAVTWSKFQFNVGAVSGVLPPSGGGTGIANAGTFTNATATTITGGGTIALGGFTATVPATGTVALIGSNNTFTAINTLKTSGSSFLFNDSANNNTIAILTGDEVGNRTLTIPLLGGNDTFATLGVSNTFTGVNTVKTSGSSFLLNDSANNNTIAILTGDEVGNRTLTIPLLGGNDTIDTLGLAQTFTAIKTHAAAIAFDTNNTRDVGTVSISAGTMYATNLKSSSGTQLTVQASIPVTAGTTTAGAALQLTASAAAPGNVTPGAAAGGSVGITAGAADRLTSGNAAGGDVVLTPGAGIGTGARGQTKILGSDGNTDAPAGYVGEFLSSYQGALQNFPATTQYGSALTDAVTITLTAGDWDVSLLVDVSQNGATITAIEGGIGTATGNSSTGTIIADNYVGGPIPPSTGDTFLAVPCWRAKVTASTTYYLKAKATYSAGNPQWRARLSARRVR